MVVSRGSLDCGDSVVVMACSVAVMAGYDYLSFLQ